MLGTFHLEIHHQPFGKMDRLVGAEARGAINAVIRGAIDRIGAPGVVEADCAFLFDIVKSAG